MHKHLHLTWQGQVGKYKGTMLTKDYVVISYVIDEHEPEFSWINDITVFEQQQIILNVTSVKYFYYNSHYHSWEIRKTNDNFLLCTNFTTRQLLIPRPTNLNTHFITLKYSAL